MFLKYILASLAMATSVLSTLLDQPLGANDYTYVGPFIDANTRYSKDQVDQLHQASNNAAHFCRTAVNVNKGDETFDRVFKKYFHIEDRDFVVNVLNQILNNDQYLLNHDPRQGARPLAFDANVELRHITIVEDFPYGDSMETACGDGKNYAQLRDWTAERPRLVVCPEAFKHASSFPLEGAPTWSGVEQLTCDNVGEHPSWKMLTMATIFLQKYTYYKNIMGDALKDYGGSTQDLARGPFQVLHLDKDKAKNNGDSYAWFATELAWTLQCNRTFGEYKEGPGSKA